MTPAVLREIGIRWLEGWSKWEIASKIGVDESTIRHHLDTSIKPLWRENMRSKLDEDLAKVEHLERTAWERFHSHSPGETVEQIEKGLLEGGSRLRIVKQATRTITKTGEAAWLQIIQWCLDFRARIHAHYAPTRHKVDLGGELRVAGMDPSQVDQAMLARLMEKIAERRKYQAAIGVGDVGNGPPPPGPKPRPSPSPPPPVSKKPWHSPDCGTKYRGCAPDCPKDTQERTGS